VRGLPFLNQQLVVEAVGFSAQIAGETRPLACSVF
jgi:hypothetical protein